MGSIEPSKTLGLGWLAESDELYFSIDSAITDVITKRSILSVIAKIFDPLGMLSPCIISMKIVLQKLWLHKLSWDEQLPPDVSESWRHIIKDLPALNKLRIPRHVSCSDCSVIDLHIFTDASQVAYGACLYMQTVNDKGDNLVRLLLSKSRVAPIKPTTIPRLELCGALVGVRLYEKTISSLRVQVRHVIFWTDSTIVLGWLKMLPSKLQPFVRNRVAEILEKTSTCTWRHVPTNKNPADYISRGVDINLIQSLDMWWYGPSFLQLDMSQWPTNPVSVMPLPETRSEVSLHIKFNPNNNIFIDFNRFSNFLRLKRVVAYVFRFINVCRRRILKNHIRFSTDELQNALNCIIRISQIESFVDYNNLMSNKKLNVKSPLIKFNIFMDENKLMRVGGRLENSDFSYDKKHPILIQSTHRFTKLLFEFEHKKLMHAGPQLLLATIRETYWPIGGRNLAKLCYRQCVKCCRMRGKIVTPIMGNLPRQRLLPGYPFEYSGVDYAGPILSANRKGQ